jgi:hypothetical protein
MYKLLQFPSFMDYKNMHNLVWKLTKTACDSIMSIIKRAEEDNEQSLFYEITKISTR